MEREAGPPAEGSEPIAPKNTHKRKRRSLEVDFLGSEQKEAQIGVLREELEGLFKYYREAMSGRVELDPAKQSSANAVVAALMEEKDAPLTKLVDEIYAEAKGIRVCEGLNMAAVKSAVLSFGQRIPYGVPNADADLLEDQLESCLWCWESRDLKLLQQSARQQLLTRRTCRKKIRERIIAVSEMMTALQKSEGDQNYKYELKKASMKLTKTSSEERIRMLICDIVQKDCANLAQKGAQREEKLQIKQLEKDKREAEKEKIRLERAMVKETLQIEKEQKRLQDEAGKEEKRRAKEESEMKKQMKKQQEEAEKEQRRREKEEAELKKRLSIRKQASIMERFVKRSKTSPIQTDQSSTKASPIVSSSKKSEKLPDLVTQSMDQALSTSENLNVEAVFKSHLSSWRHLGHSLRSNRKQCWGIRQKPKTELFKQIKLTTTTTTTIATSPLVVMDESDDDRFVDDFGECVSDGGSRQTNASCSLPDVKACTRGKKLLQFDKSHRPAFYGTWPQQSQVVGARRPLRKDPELDYDVDSDEEWEEEDPGESLSDCDKDEEDENLDEGGSKADDGDESEDDFFVPDGYLSENEGVQVESMDSDVTAEEPERSPALGSEEFSALLRKQKYLNNVTERALKKSQPLIISNLMHEKASLLTAEDLVGTPKLEQICLQALTIRVFHGSSFVPISHDIVEEVIDVEVCTPKVKDSATPTPTVTSIPDSDLRTIVSIIQTCSTGIHKLGETLRTKFPAFSKSQLRNKVREIANFSENRWQVKKEILQKLGLPITPEKSPGQTKSIASFFSKRCLPPSDKAINPNEVSPLPPRKTSSAAEGQPQ